MWKWMSLLVAMPGVAICYLNMYLKEAEHKAHYERPEFIPYDHLRRRTKVRHSTGQDCVVFSSSM
jgi:cytochrome c oxidase subunit 6a